jgi:hypothetical protein
MIFKSLFGFNKLSLCNLVILAVGSGVFAGSVIADARRTARLLTITLSNQLAPE